MELQPQATCCDIVYSGIQPLINVVTRSILCHCRVLCLGDTLPSETLSAGQIVGLIIAVIIVIIIVDVIVVVLVLRRLRSRLYRFHINLLLYTVKKLWLTQQLVATL